MATQDWFSRCFCRLICLKPRFSLGVMLVLFSLRAASFGDLQRWVDMLATLAAEHFWLTCSALAVTILIFYTRNGFVLCPVLFGAVVMADAELLTNIFTCSVQLVVLLNQIAVSFVDFIACAIRSVPALFGCLISGSKSGLKPVDWIAAFVVQLWLFRLMYALAGLRRLRLADRRTIEKECRQALQQPFQAEFDQDFGKDVDGETDMFQAIPAKRQFSHLFLQTACEPELSPSYLEALEEKHATLLMLRQSAREENFDTLLDLLPDTLQLSIRHEQLFEDSWKALLEAPIVNILAPSLAIQYVGEDGVDGGGLSRDWFNTLGQVLVEDADDDNGTSLLAVGKSSMMLIPRPQAASSTAATNNHRGRDMLLAGRFLALGLVHCGRPLPQPLSPLICKYILGLPVDMKDVELLDPSFYSQRIAPLVRKGGLDKMEQELGEPLTFVSVPTELKPEEELEPGGATTRVTEQNLPRYLRLLCDAYLCSEIRCELQCLLRGFWDVVSLDMLRVSGLTANDLSLLLSGTRGLDMVSWRMHTQVEGKESSLNEEEQQVIAWFWQVMHTINEETRRDVLRFATGSGRLPPGGFAKLNPPFTLAVTSAMSSEHLPQARTCVHRIDLCRYRSKEQLQAKLLKSCSTRSFGFS